MRPHFVSQAEQQRVIISLNPRAGAREGGSTPNELPERLEGMGYVVETTSAIEEVLRQTERYQADGALRAVVSSFGSTMRHSARRCSVRSTVRNWLWNSTM